MENGPQKPSSSTPSSQRYSSAGSKKKEHFTLPSIDLYNPALTPAKTPRRPATRDNSSSRRDGGAEKKHPTTPSSTTRKVAPPPPQMARRPGETFEQSSARRPPRRNDPQAPSSARTPSPRKQDDDSSTRRGASTARKAGSSSLYRHPELHPPHHFHGRKRAMFQPKPPAQPTSVHLQASCETLRSILATKKKVQAHRERSKSRSPTADSPTVGSSEDDGSSQNSPQSKARQAALQGLARLIHDERTKPRNLLARAAAKDAQQGSSAGDSVRGDASTTTINHDDEVNSEAGSTSRTPTKKERPATTTNSEVLAPLCIDVGPMLGDTEALAVVDAFIESTPNLELVNLGMLSDDKYSQLALRNIFNALTRNVNILRVEGSVPPYAQAAIDAAVAENQLVRAKQMQRRNDEAREAAITMKEAEIKREQQERQNLLFDIWRERTACVDTQKKQHKKLVAEESRCWSQLLQDEGEARDDACTRATQRIEHWNGLVGALEDEMFTARNKSIIEEERARRQFKREEVIEYTEIRKRLREQKRAEIAAQTDVMSSEYENRKEARRVERTTRRELENEITAALKALRKKEADIEKEKEAELRRQEALERERELWARQCEKEQLELSAEETEGRKEVEHKVQRAWEQIIRANFESATTAKIRQQQRVLMEKRLAQFHHADAAVPRVSLRFERPHPPVYRLNPHSRSLILNPDATMQIKLNVGDDLSEAQKQRKMSIRGGFITVKSPQMMKPREAVTLIVPGRALANPNDPLQYAPFRSEECYEDPALTPEQLKRIKDKTPNIPEEDRPRRSRLKINKSGRRVYWDIRPDDEIPLFGENTNDMDNLLADKEKFVQVGRIVQGAMKAGKYVDPKSIKVTKSVVVDAATPFHFASDDEEALFNDEYDENEGPPGQSWISGTVADHANSIRSRSTDVSLLEDSRADETNSRIEESFDASITELETTVGGDNTSTAPARKPSSALQTPKSTRETGAELFKLEVSADAPHEAVNAILTSLAYFNGSETGHSEEEDNERMLQLYCQVELCFRKSCILEGDSPTNYPQGVTIKEEEPMKNITPIVSRIASVHFRTAYPIISSPPIRTQLFLEESKPIPIFNAFSMCYGGHHRWSDMSTAGIQEAVFNGHTIQGSTMTLSVVNHDGGDVFKLKEKSELEIADRDEHSRELRFFSRLVGLVEGPLLSHEEYMHIKDDDSHSEKNLYGEVKITLLHDTSTSLQMFRLLVTSLMYGSLTIDPHPNQRSIDLKLEDKEGRMGIIRRRLKVVPVDDITTIDLKVEDQGAVYRVAHELRSDMAEFMPSAPPFMPFLKAIVEDPDSVDFNGGYLEVEVISGAKDGDCLYLMSDEGIDITNVDDATGQVLLKDSDVLIENPTFWDPLEKQRKPSTVRSSSINSSSQLGGSSAPFAQASGHSTPSDTASTDGTEKASPPPIQPIALPSILSSGSVRTNPQPPSGDGGPTRIHIGCCEQAELQLVTGCAFTTVPPRLSRREMHRGRRASAQNSAAQNSLNLPPNMSLEPVAMDNQVPRQNSVGESSSMDPSPRASDAPAITVGDAPPATAANNNPPRQYPAIPEHGDTAASDTSKETHVSVGRKQRHLSTSGNINMPAPNLPTSPITPLTQKLGSDQPGKVAFASLLIRIEFGFCTVEALQALVRRIAFKPCGTHPNTPKGFGKREIEVRMVVGDPNIPKYRKFDPFTPVSSVGDILVCEPLVQATTQPMTYKEGSGAMSLGHITLTDESSLGYRSWNGGYVHVQIVKGGNQDDRIYIRSLDPNVSDAGMGMQEVDPHSLPTREDQEAKKARDLLKSGRKMSSLHRVDSSAPASPSRHRSGLDLNNMSTEMSVSTDGTASPEKDRSNPAGPPAVLLERVRKAISSKDKNSGSYRTSELYTSERSYVGTLTAALTECHIGFREFDKKRLTVAKHQMSLQMKKSASGRSGEEKVPAGMHRRDVVPSNVLAKLPNGCTPIKRRDMQNLLKLITYECRSANPVELRKVIKITITDGCPTSFTQVLLEINVQPVDDATEIRRSTIGSIPFRHGFPQSQLPVFEHCTLFDADTELFNGGFFTATLSAGDCDGDGLFLLDRQQQEDLKSIKKNDPFSKFRGQPKKAPKKKKPKNPDEIDMDEFIPDFVENYPTAEEYEFEFDYDTNEINIIEAQDDDTAFTKTSRVGTFTLNVPKKSGEPSINVTFSFPALIDEENIDPDEDEVEHPVPVPLSLIEGLMKCIVFRSSANPTKIRTGSRTFAARVTPGGGAEEGRIKLIASVTPTLISVADNHTLERRVVYRKKMGSMHPLQKFVVLADILLKVGFIAVEIVDGFNATDDVVKINDIGNAKPFQLKNQGKSLYTNKDLYCGGFQHITDDAGNVKGFCLSFDGQSRISGSMVQLLVRSMTYSNTALTPYEGHRLMKVTLCDGTYNETSQFDMHLDLELDEECIETAWGPSNGNSLLIVPGHAPNLSPSLVASIKKNNKVKVFQDFTITQTTTEAGETKVLNAPSCMEIEGGKGDTLYLLNNPDLGVEINQTNGAILVNSEPVGFLVAMLPHHQQPGGRLGSAQPNKTPRESNLSTPKVPPLQSVADSDSDSNLGNASTSSTSKTIGSRHQSTRLDTSTNMSPTTPAAIQQQQPSKIRIKLDNCSYASLEKVFKAVIYERKDAQLGNKPIRVVVYGAQNNVLLKFTCSVDITEPLFSCGAQFLSPISEVFPTCNVKYVPKTIIVSWLQLGENGKPIPFVPPTPPEEVLEMSMSTPRNNARRGRGTPPPSVRGSISSVATGQEAPTTVTARRLSSAPRTTTISLTINTRMGIIRKDNNDLFFEKDKIGVIVSGGNIPATTNSIQVELNKKANIQAVQRLMRSFALAPNVQYTPHEFSVEFTAVGGSKSSESFHVSFPTKKK